MTGGTDWGNHFKAVKSPKTALSKEATDPLNLWHAPDAPELPEAPKAPTIDDPAVADAAKREREAQLKAKGRASTILTGAEGDTSKPNLARRQLLGS